MRISILLGLIFILGLVNFSCKTIKEVPTQLKQLEFLLGDWQNIQSQSMHESWEREAKDSFKGFGYRLSGQDTIIIEKLRIEVQGENVFYIADVPHNSAPVPFQLHMEENSFVFENQDHDFPNRIVYTPRTTDSLTVTAEGTEGGKPKVLLFRFVKGNP